MDSDSDNESSLFNDEDDGCGAEIDMDMEDPADSDVSDNTMEDFFRLGTPSAPSSPEMKAEPSPTIKKEKSDDPSQGVVRCVAIDLCNEDKPFVTGHWEKARRRQPKFDASTIGDPIIAIEDSDTDCDVADDPDHTEFPRQVQVKSENFITLGTSECIDLDSYSEGKDRIKKEPGCSPDDWKYTDGEIIDLDAPLAAQRPQQRRLDKATALEMQGKLLAQIREKRSCAADANRDFESSQIFREGQSLGNDALETLEEDDDPVREFEELDSIYKAKKRAKKATLADEVTHKRAKTARNNHLRRVADEADQQDENSNEEDNLPLSTPAHLDLSYLKGLLGASGASVDDAVAQKLLDGLKKNEPSVQSKEQRKEEQKLKNAYKKQRADELYRNMIAGIEHILNKDELKEELRQSKDARQSADAKSAGTKRGGRKPKAKVPDLSNIDSLTTANPIRDSNANLGKQTLPVVSAKKKRDFLTSLVASIPPEIQQQAKAEAGDLDRASINLGKWQCKPAKDGGWNFKGLKSSLYHHQLLGASAMKNRELGDSAPFGGILVRSITPFGY